MEFHDIHSRFTYHSVAKPAKVKALQDIRLTAKSLAFLINSLVPDSREKSTAISRLEEAVMWANAGIARHQHRDPADGGEDTFAIATTGEAGLKGASADGQ